MPVYGVLKSFLNQQRLIRDAEARENAVYDKFKMFCAEAELVSVESLKSRTSTMKSAYVVAQIMNVKSSGKKTINVTTNALRQKMAGSKRDSAGVKLHAGKQEVFYDRMIVFRYVHLP
jgi:hypothetical protein